MEKRAIKLSDLLFAVVGLAVIVCMFLNWVPIELNLGAVQLSNVLGNINALNFCARLGELEESIGDWASLLPEKFDQVKVQSILVAMAAGLTIFAYVTSIVLRFMRKDRYTEALSWLAGIGAIVTCVSFRAVIEGIGEYIGLTTVGYDVLNVVNRSPCTVILLGGVISICCTEIVTKLIANLIGAMISAIVDLLIFAAEWAKMIVNNIGYIVSDVIGGTAGVYLGVWLNNATEFIILAVVAGLTVAGLVAFVCMKIVDMVFLKKKESAVQ